MTSLQPEWHVIDSVSASVSATVSASVSAVSDSLSSWQMHF